MKIEGAIFDFDGTLVDSMFIWENLAFDYLVSLGITPDISINKFAECMTLADMALIYQKEYGVTLSVEEILSDIKEKIDERYRSEVMPKEGVLAFLESLYNKGVKMCIATLSQESVVRMVLEKFSMSHYFSEIFTTSSVGKGKNEPDMYLAALRYLGTQKENTIVFEDALYAAKTAKNAGFPLAAIYDVSEKQQEELKALSDVYIETYTNVNDVLKEWDERGK